MTTSFDSGNVGIGILPEDDVPLCVGGNAAAADTQMRIKSHDETVEWDFQVETGGDFVIYDPTGTGTFRIDSGGTDIFSVDSAGDMTASNLTLGAADLTGNNPTLTMVNDDGSHFLRVVNAGALALSIESGKNFTIYDGVTLTSANQLFGIVNGTKTMTFGNSGNTVSGYIDLSNGANENTAFRVLTNDVVEASLGVSSNAIMTAGAGTTPGFQIANGYPGSGNLVVQHQFLENTVTLGYQADDDISLTLSAGTGNTAELFLRADGSADKFDFKLSATGTTSIVSSDANIPFYLNDDETDTGKMFTIGTNTITVGGASITGAKTWTMENDAGSIDLEVSTAGESYVNVGNSLATGEQQVQLVNDAGDVTMLLGSGGDSAIVSSDTNLAFHLGGAAAATNRYFNIGSSTVTVGGSSVTGSKTLTLKNDGDQLDMTLDSTGEIYTETLNNTLIRYVNTSSVVNDELQLGGANYWTLRLNREGSTATTNTFRCRIANNGWTDAGTFILNGWFAQGTGVGGDHLSFQFVIMGTLWNGTAAEISRSEIINLVESGSSGVALTSVASTSSDWGFDISDLYLDANSWTGGCCQISTPTSYAPTINTHDLV